MSKYQFIKINDKPKDDFDIAWEKEFGEVDSERIMSAEQTLAELKKMEEFYDKFKQQSR